MNGFIGRDVPGALKPGELVSMEAPIAYPDYRRYRERTDLFTGTLALLAGYVPARQSMRIDPIVALREE